MYKNKIKFEILKFQKISSLKKEDLVERKVGIATFFFDKVGYDLTIYNIEMSTSRI